MRWWLWRILSALMPDGWVVYDMMARSETTGFVTLHLPTIETPTGYTASDAVTSYVITTSRTRGRKHTRVHTR